MDPIADAGVELGKRKRSPSSASMTAIVAAGAKPAKIVTTNSLSINYLARQSSHDLPLLNKDDSLPNLINLLTAYSSVLDRQESLASNLGARPLGPILIKRFERCFDAPPKIIASHQRTVTGPVEDVSPSITWLEVIEFARSHPIQFTLGAFSEGRRVCQFYYPQKQLRVQISEEDFLFINSGRCQELIPPLPIWEDEEKEVGACDVLDAKLRELTNVADMVAARTRQLSHRLKGRRAAILERRAEGGSGTPAKAVLQQTTTAPPLPSPGPGVRPYHHAESHVRPTEEVTHEPPHGTLTSVRSELLRHFESLPHNQNVGWSQSRQPSAAGFPEAPNPPRHGETIIETVVAHVPVSTASSLSPGPQRAVAVDAVASHAVEQPLRAPSTAIVPNFRAASNAPVPSQQGSLKHNFSRPLNPALESTQPFRPLCQAHMDSLPRGSRVLPPCDRCRRLRMDCVKNLTSCAGCTKKHARCHWRDVGREEISALDHLLDSVYSESVDSSEINHSHGPHGRHEDSDDDDDDDDSNPLEDLEAIGKKDDPTPQEVSTGRSSRNVWDAPKANTRPDNGISKIVNAASTDDLAKGPRREGDVPNGHRESAEKRDSGSSFGRSSDRHTAHPSPSRLPKQEMVDLPPASHGGFRAVNDMLRASADTNGVQGS